VPSFEIRGAGGLSNAPRWDRVNSRALIDLARRVYFSYLSNNPSAPDPLGVVVDQARGDGRVVFEAPVLLPDEDYLNFDLIRQRGSRLRNRCKS
tara:strand:+ start:190 stop:471 length:282 start_codon:yes stop_codon:yes gene_type:complete